MKMATRLSFLLLIAVLSTITLTSAQDATFKSAPTARHNETGEPLQSKCK